MKSVTSRSLDRRRATERPIELPEDQPANQQTDMTVHDEGEKHRDIAVTMNQQLRFFSDAGSSLAPNQDFLKARLP